MSRISGSLVKSWTELGQHLGIQFSNSSATAASCPFCRTGRIAFYNDCTTHGRRFVSSCCGRTGDQLQLIADIKHISRDEALLFMGRHLPDLMVGYQESEPRRKAYETEMEQQQAIWRAALPVTEATNCSSFKSFIEKHKLEFTHLLSWHRTNLNLQYRWLPKLRYSSVVTTTTRRGRPLENDWPTGADGLLISQLFGSPGLPSGLLYQFTNPAGGLSQQFRLADQESDDPGYLVHPGMAVKSDPLVVCRDAGWQLRGAFYQAHHGGESLNPYLTAFDTLPHRTQRPDLILGRCVLFWVGRLNGYTLRAAIRLNARITTFGSVNGELAKRCLTEIDPKSPYRSLERRSATWESALHDFSRQATAPEVLELISAADLTVDEREQAIDCLEERTKPFVQGGTYNVCPPAVLYGTYGSIEQTPKGWELSSRGRKELICNRPWRIARTIAAGAGQEAGYLVEFYHDGRWIGETASQLAMHVRLMPTLVGLCVKLGITPLTIDSKWTTRALHIAMQLAPPAEPLPVRPVGLDNRSGVLRMNRCELSILDGTLEKRATAGSDLLFPLADGEPPGRQAVRHLSENPHARKIISALVFQLLAVTAGRRAVAVLVGGQTARLAGQILQQCQLTAGSLAIKLDIVPFGSSLLTASRTRRAVADLPLWGSGSANTAHWLAGHRPTVFISRRTDRFAFQMEDLQVQRTVVRLLAGAIRSATSGSPLSQAVADSWAELYRQAGLLETADQIAREAAIRRPSVLSRQQAVGYWVSRGMIDGLLTVTGSLPRKVLDSSCWAERSSDSFRIAKSAVQNILQAYRYPAWDFTTLFGHRDGDPLTCNHTRRNNVVAVRLPVGILSVPARKLLASTRRRCPERKPEVQSESKTG